MAYEAQTKVAILQRMLDASAADIDKRVGSVTNDLLSPASIEMALAYIELDNIARFGFADTTYGVYLDYRCGEMGVTRKASVKATGSVTFTGANGTLIPKGTQVSTGGQTPVYFVTTADSTVVSGSVTVTAEASAGGANGNVAASAIKLVLGNLSGVVTVTNAAAFNGGTETETDAALLARYLDRVRKPSTSGNANQYRQWALEVAGISDAKVYPIWNGNGTVKVVLLDTNKRAPIASKVTEVSTYIASVRPIGATVTVQAATEVAINVTATLTLKAGRTLTQAKTEIETGLAAYLKPLAFVDSVVRYSLIGAMISECASVADYSGLTVNGGTTNATIADGSVAVSGSVTVS